MCVLTQYTFIQGEGHSVRSIGHIYPEPEIAQSAYVDVIESATDFLINLINTMKAAINNSLRRLSA